MRLSGLISSYFILSLKKAPNNNYIRQSSASKNRIDYSSYRRNLCSDSTSNVINTDYNSNYDKEYEHFIYDRDWNIVKQYWANIVEKSCNSINFEMPTFLEDKGKNSY